jgi:energy-coupling factor transport system substrate-specific component
MLLLPLPEIWEVLAMSTTSITNRLGIERGPWRTIDLMTASLIGVTFGIVYWGWSTAYTAITTPGVTSALGPAIGLLGGPWLIAGVVGGLVVRRPGAALFAELLAAAVEALVGNEWGWATLISGSLQGVGVEIGLLLFFYRRFGWPVAAICGALAAAAEMAYEWHAYWVGLSFAWKMGYLGCFMLSGAVVAGLGGWALTRALAASGAIDALPAGREAAADHQQ